MASTIFDQISIKIIQEQSLVIGPLAWSEAQKVSGIHIIDRNKNEIELSKIFDKSFVY